MADNKLLYRVPITTVENDGANFAVGQNVHFCPGPVGGDEWNTPGFDPTTNLILSGTVDWCDTVEIKDDNRLAAVAVGQPFTGIAYLNPINMFGKEARTDGYWAGWVYASDADTGVWKWRAKSNYPDCRRHHAHGGRLVFVGDLGGNFYALDSSTGQKLWSEVLGTGGGIGGGVITYTVDGKQRVAVADGFTMVAWPTKPQSARVVVLGLDDSAAEAMMGPTFCGSRGMTVMRTRRDPLMELDPVFLSRLQFGFVITFHIIFPAFTIGLGAWLATIEGARLVTGKEVYRRVFDFWIKIFALSFGMGVVTGVVMAFQFGTNWGVLAEKTGSIQGPLLGYESFTAFMLEASFFGVMLLGRNRVSPRFYFFACCMVSLGTMFSSFWILANNSWMQVPVGYCDCERQDHSHGLVGHRNRPGHDGALAAHVAGRVPDNRHVRRVHRRLVRAAQHPSRRGARDVELGIGAGRRDHSGPALLRAPDGALRAEAPAGQVRGDRGALEERAAGVGNPHRHSRYRRPKRTCSRFQCPS